MTTPKQLAAFIAQHQGKEIEEVQNENFFKDMDSLDRLDVEVGVESEFNIFFDAQEGVTPDDTIQSLTTKINAKTH